MAVTAEVPTGAAWERRAVDRTLHAARHRSSERARRLVGAARELAARAGSSPFTMAEVADAAGVPLRTLYRQFPGRDELLLALLEEEARTGAEILSARLAPLAAPIDRLRTFVEDLAALVVTGSGYASLLVREHLRLGDLHPEELRTALTPLLDLLAAELDAAAAAGDIRPVDDHDVATVFALVLTQPGAVEVLAPAGPAATATTRLWEFCHAALRPQPPARRPRRKDSR